MASKEERDERRRQRQRGAATRQVKNIGFELVLPSLDPPLQPRKSGRSRKTPQPDVLPPQRSSRRTPAPEELLPQRSTRRTPATATSQKRKRAPTIGEPETSLSKHAVDSEVVEHGDAQVTTKRRKLEKQPVEAVGDSAPKEVTRLGANDYDQTPLAAGRVKKRKKRKSIGQQSMKRAHPKGSPRRSQPAPAESSKTSGAAKAPGLIEDHVQRTRPQPQSHGASVESGDQGQILQELAGAADIESEGPVTGSSMKEPQKNTRKRKRRFIGQQSKKRSDAKVFVDRRIVALHEASPPPVELKLESPQTIQVGSSMGTSPIENTPQEQDLSQVASLPKQTRSKRKKRKSIGQQKPRRTSTDAISTKNTLKRTSDGGQAPAPKARTDAGTATSRAKETLRKPPTPADDEEQDDILAERTPENNSTIITNEKRRPGRPPKAGGKVSTKPLSTKVQRPTKQTPIQPKPPPPKPRNPPTDSIPITLYRPSPLASASDSDSDPLTASIPPAPKTINAIDVLAQITRELISKSAPPLPPGSQNPASKRKKNTTDLYAAELESRLRQLGGTLNTSTVLAARVRKMAAEERRMKKMVKEVEKEREEVRGRRAAALESKKRLELEKLLKGISGAVQRGWAMGGDA